MNKTKIKNFSIWARRNLIEVVAYRMRFLGIDENGIAPEMEGSTDKLKLYHMGTSKPAEVAGRDISKRVRLANHIREHEKTSDYKTAYETVVEEIAYTWFNRLIAIRFMEVNDYLPSGVRVLSSENGKREPDIVTQAIEVAEDQKFSISTDEIWKLKDENKLDALFRIMFIQQCKKLHDVLPELFDNSQDDYTELLLPISFIDDDAFIRHLVTDIDEEDFDLSKQGQVEIIGWLYQYYNSEKKDAVFAAMSKKIKVSKENIAAATQLFTPDWIVRYMVENSLGRLWVDGHADTSARSEWKYYLDEAEQTPEVQIQLSQIREERKNLSPKQIRFIDPCMGSGHILVYAFELLMQIYLSCGYAERDAAQSIVNYNLWGLDLDKRAYQLAYFAVIITTRRHDRRLWHRIENGEFDAHLPHLSHFQDLPVVDYSMLNEPVKSFVQQFENADTYGSLISVQADEETDKALDDFQPVLDFSYSHMEHLMQLYKILSQRYDVVCTNPPYMAMSNANAVLKNYVEKNFPDSKSDLFAVFIEKCSELAKIKGYYSMITQHAFMFLSSYEKLRQKLQLKTTVNMAHLGARAFDEISGEVVQTTAFVNFNTRVSSYLAIYKRLLEGMSEAEKRDLFFSGKNTYTSIPDDFNKIPGSPVAYWVSDQFFKLFENIQLGDIAKPRQGMATTNNNLFLRFWYEVDNDKIGFSYHNLTDTENGKHRWFPYNKGGDYRKWYGNQQYVVNWYKNGLDLKEYTKDAPGGRMNNMEYYFMPSDSWSKITSGKFAVRYFPNGFIFDVAGCSIFSEDKLIYLLGILNSTVAESILKAISPTLNYEVEHIKKIPIILPANQHNLNTVNNLVEENINICKSDWDSFETSWDFKKHPFIQYARVSPQKIAEEEKNGYLVMNTLQQAYESWERACNERFEKLKANEEELNRIFIEIYGLQDELTPDVDDKDVTVRKADLQRDMRSFVSYAVGCMLGRYSLDTEGLAYAGGAWDDSKYQTFTPEKSNCLPITEEYFFENDIVSRFADFVKTAFGAGTLEENLRFIAENLGIKGNGTAREKIRQYFLKDFFKDHCKIYQKRPIYWLFDTGKKNGFKALCYLHRWTVNTVGDVRIDYMHTLQRLYRNEIIRLQENIDNGEEIAKSQKRLEKITTQLKETEEYDAKIGMIVSARTEIDLDDGVKVNYEKIQLGSDGKKYQILATI